MSFLEDNGLYRDKKEYNVRLPSDFLSDEEIEALSGECYPVEHDEELNKIHVL